MFDKSKENIELANRIFLNDLDECLNYPKYICIETVNKCNAKCNMCSINLWNKRDNAFISDELFLKFVEEIKDYTNWIETVYLYKDGEPTLDKHLGQRIKMLKDIGIKKVAISTNAQLLNAQLATELINSGIDEISISMDSLQKEVYEKIRIGLNYDVVLDNIFNLIRIRDELNSKMSIRLRMIVVNENKNEVNEYLKYWKEKISSNDRVYAMPAHNWGNQKSDVLVNNTRNIDKPCVSPFSTMLINVDGKVGLCCIDYNLKHFVGDFSKQSIEEIWTNTYFNNIRKIHSENKKYKIDMCKNCDIWNREYVDVNNI